MKELIKKLVEAVGPSGYEGQVRDIVRAEVEKFADEVRVDALGNLIAVKGAGNSKGKKIMLAAHMDEIGVMATHIDDNGFIRFTNIGGVRPHTCYGGRVRFLNGVQGVINSERLTDIKEMPPLEKMYIDVGATSRGNCPVKVGDVACFDRPFAEMGGRLVAKAFDDRIAVATLISVLQGLKKTPNQLYFVFTVQEEVGLRGATTAAFGVDPDLGIAVDVTLTGDTPRGFKFSMALGKGPAIKVRDESLVTDPRMIRWAVESAENKKIPYQYEVLVGGGTDAGAIHTSRAGVPSICVSVPCRYVHSPSEMVDFEDVQNTVRLVSEMVSNPVELR